MTFKIRILVIHRWNTTEDFLRISLFHTTRVTFSCQAQ